jgi:hypothetical protein
MTRDDALSLADHILTLVNSQPRTPSRDDLADAIMALPPPNITGPYQFCCGDPGDCNDLGCALRQAYHYGKKEGQQVAQHNFPDEATVNITFTGLPPPLKNGDYTLGTLPAGTIVDQEVIDKLWAKIMNDAFDATERMATFQAEINERRSKAISTELTEREAQAAERAMSEKFPGFWK